jgi:hypothetical protein
MEKTNPFDLFLEIVRNRSYTIDLVQWKHLGEFPITHSSFDHPSKLKAALVSYINQILFSSNENKQEIIYLKSVITNYLEDFEEKSINGKKYFLQANFKVNELDYDFGPQEYFSKEIDTLKIDNELLDHIQTYSRIKHQQSIGLIDKINEKLRTYENGNEQICKLQLKLSVPEIALLFRLLDDEKLINSKHKTEIYKHIATTLKTEKQENISEASIKNKFLSPDTKAIENLKILLTNLKIRLNNIEDKISR